MGRQVFSDTAVSLSGSSQKLGEQVKPTQEESDALKGPGADENQAPSSEALRSEAAQVADAAERNAIHTGQEAIESTKERLSGKQRETLMHRLKQAVLKLREQSDYSDSVSTLSQLGERYVKAYTRAASSTASAAQADTDTNADVKEAVHHFWVMIQSLGDPMEWRNLEQKFHDLLRHSQDNPEFEQIISEFGAMLREMLTDPDFFDSASQKLDELKERSKQLGS